MTTKLTLSVEQNTIEKAKHFAKTKNTSLSKLIENYLQKITYEQSSVDTITPLVKSLSGIINADESENYKKEYSNYLSKKYK
jgi:hypothetical protein